MNTASTTSATRAARPHDRYFSDFAAALRYWREKRGYSQLRLSADAAVSQRHISFLESGRSQPSRELILKLGAVLDIPLRQRNVMLLAAGFAPAYQERRLSDPELHAVKQALDFMLRQQAPYPAIVVDRLWNLVMANDPARHLLAWLLGLPGHHSLPALDGINALRLMLDPAGIGRHVGNRCETAGAALHWIQREAMSDGPHSEATALLDSLRQLAGLDALPQAADLDARALPFLPIELEKDGVRLRLFTTIATLGTPHDVTVHELRIESFFPADEETAAWFRSAAGL
ncbi:MAG TPA: helix-turn-helix transcriptional regulator [Paucimonas sp.]|nr:helix-turn-helix transcriptional regulator [Paucimonas sp.]